MTKPVKAPFAWTSKHDSPYQQINDCMDMVRQIRKVLRNLPVVDTEFNRRRLTALD